MNPIAIFHWLNCHPGVSVEFKKLTRDIFLVWMRKDNRAVRWQIDLMEFSEIDNVSHFERILEKIHTQLIKIQ